MRLLIWDLEFGIWNFLIPYLKLPRSSFYHPLHVLGELLVPACHPIQVISKAQQEEPLDNVCPGIFKIVITRVTVNTFILVKDVKCGKFDFPGLIFKELLCYPRIPHGYALVKT
jgi:hypothetical protein